MCVQQVSVCTRNVARTPPPVNKSSTFQIHQRVTEERNVSQTTDTRWRQVTRCAGHEIVLFPVYAGKLNTCSHLTECAEKPEDTSRTSPSARKTGSNKSPTSQSSRMDQTTYFALLEMHKKHRFALPRVREHKLVLGRVYQTGTMRYTRIWSTTPKRMTMNDTNNASLFPMD